MSQGITSAEGSILDLSALEQITPYPEDIVFKIDGLSAEEYITALTKEMDSIDFDSIPFDKWDYILAFSLALVEATGDFFIGDPGFKHSLANKNGPFVKWLDQFHDKIGHAGQPLDYQGPDFGGGGHRACTFGHDSLPLARILYGAKTNENDSKEIKVEKNSYNGILLLRDIISCGFAIYQITSGTFVDCVFTKEGAYKWIVTTANQNGTPYESCNVFTAIVKYFSHMIADFCSSMSLPIPGFSLLTHWPDRDIEAFAMKLYKNGMNLRTMALGGIPVGITELIMTMYVHLRYTDSNWSQEAIQHKKEKMLLLTHGITTAVNVGKVILTKNPARLNLILVARTCYLVWKVVTDKMKLTNKAMIKLEMGVVKARIESMQTLILLDRTIYETKQYDHLINEILGRLSRQHKQNADDNISFDVEFDEIMKNIQ